MAGILAGALAAAGVPSAAAQEVQFWQSPPEPPSSCVTLYWTASESPERAEITAEGYAGAIIATDGPVGFCEGEPALLTLTLYYADGRQVTAQLLVSYDPAHFTGAPSSTTTGSPAASMPAYLVLTHIDRLNSQLGVTGSWADVEALLEARYGRPNYRVIDFGAEPVIPGALPNCDPSADCQQAKPYRDVVLAAVAAAGEPRYVIIIGGPDVVPFGAWANPADLDHAYTDDWYGDLDNDLPHHVPDVAVARVPDGRDLGLIEAIFAANERTIPTGAANDVYAHGQPARLYAEEMAHRLLGNNPAHPDWSHLPRWTLDPDPNARPSLWLPQAVDATYTYFILHGSWEDTTAWWGEDPAGGASPVAFTVADADSSGLVVSQACYGAFISRGQTAADSIALHFLESGAFAFVGSTASSYSSVEGSAMPPNVIDEGLTICTESLFGLFGEDCVVSRPRVVDALSRGAQALAWAVFEGAMSSHPLDAYLGAKQAFVQRTGLGYRGEKKVLHTYVYYGLPPAPAYVEPEGG